MPGNYLTAICVLVAPQKMSKMVATPQLVLSAPNNMEVDILSSLAIQPDMKLG